MKFLDSLTIEDLRLILAIIEKGSLTAGAAHLRMGQSNASYSLKKIQNAFEANLFTKKGRTLVPNELGWHVYGTIKTMLADFDQVADAPVFNPQSAFTLRFAATEYETIAIFPDILQMLARHAPRAKVEIHALRPERLASQIDDLDFVFYPEDIGSGKIRTQKIFEDQYLTYYDSTKRPAPDQLRAFCEARHMVVSASGNTQTNIDTLLAAKGLTRDVAMTVFGFAALAGLLSNTDMITTLPAQLSNGLFSKLASCECPIKTETMPLYLCWNSAKDENGKNRWFRNQLENSVLAK